MKTRWIVLLVVLFTLLGGIRAARSRHVAGDFLRYHRAGRLVATGRADKLYDKDFLRTQTVYAEERAADVAKRGRKADDLVEREFKYLPATAVLMAPFGALHPRWGGAFWGAWNAFLLAVAFWATWHVCARGVPKRWLLVPFAILAHVANDNLNLGQINPSAMFPAMLALLALSHAVTERDGPTWWSRHRCDVAAGVLAAFGSVVKFYPLVVLLWMAWKRRWVAFATGVLGVVLIGGVLPALVLGPTESIELTKEYKAVRAHVYTSKTVDDVPGYSVKSFVYRTFGDIPFVKRGSSPVELRTNVASLDPGTLWTLTWIGNGLVLLVMIWAGLGPLRGPPALSDALRGGLLLTSVVLISPEARGPHFLYLLFAVVALTGLLARHPDAKGTRWYKGVAASLVACGLLLNTSSTSLFGEWLSDRLSAVCAMGFGALVLLVALALTIRRGPETARPAPLPARTPGN